MIVDLYNYGFITVFSSYLGSLVRARLSILCDGFPNPYLKGEFDLQGSLHCEWCYQKMCRELMYFKLFYYLMTILFNKIVLNKYNNSFV